jgi:hypothetical protein
LQWKIFLIREFYLNSFYWGRNFLLIVWKVLKILVEFGGFEEAGWGT